MRDKMNKNDIASESELVSFPDSENQTNEIIDDRNMDQRKIDYYEDKKIKNKDKFFLGKKFNKFVEKISELASIDKIKQKFKEIKNDQNKNLKNDLKEKRGVKL